MSIARYFRNPQLLGLAIARRLTFLPDKQFLQLRYFFEMGHRLNLKNPQTFTEKIQWLKLFNRRPEYALMVDKLSVKNFVAQRIGNDIVIPTIGIWNRPEEIDFDLLPDSFVLKTNHDGGSLGVIIVKDKNAADFSKIKQMLSVSLKNDIYTYYREWPYKNIKRQIFAEPYMQDGDNAELIDYKFYCFNGKPYYCQVIADRKKGETIDFYDIDWKHMPFYGLNPMPFYGLNSKVGQAVKSHPKPTQYNLMLRYAEKIAEGIPFLRVDLYEINNKVYFGETTFFPASGYGVFTPAEWNDKLGQLIDLTVVK